jgi:hypothetical protein
VFVVNPKTDTSGRRLTAEPLRQGVEHFGRGGLLLRELLLCVRQPLLRGGERRRRVRRLVLC